MKSIDESKLGEYVSKIFGQGTVVKSVEKLGEGMHGIGYAINIIENGKEKRYVLKTLREEAFGHEYAADRANVIIRALMDHNLLPNHVKVLDAGSIQTDGKLLSLGKPEEFFIIMEEAKGIIYWNDFDEIRDRGNLTEKDVQRIKILAKYLASMHNIGYGGNNSNNLYKKVVRDFVGHGELIMGLLDTFPDNLKFISRKEMIDIVKKSVELWDKIKGKNHRLVVVHSDFYPGNILFDGDKLVITDRSRFRYGEAANDIASFSINIINYSVLTYGDFRDPFKKLWEILFEEYPRCMNDKEMFKVAPLFFVFAALVCIHPVFYSAQWMKRHGFSEESIERIDENKKKMVNFAKSVAMEDEFDINKISSYLGL